MSYNNKQCKHCKNISKKDALAMMSNSCDIAIDNFLRGYSEDVVKEGKKRYLDDLEKYYNKHQIYCYIYGHSSLNHAHEIERRFKRYYNTVTEEWVEV